MPRTKAQTETIRIGTLADAGTNLVARLLQAMSRVQQRRRERQSLARLDTHMLRDIGLDQERAASESRKPFWQA